MKFILKDQDKVIVETDVIELDTIAQLIRESIYGISKEIPIRVGISFEEAESLLMNIRSLVDLAQAE
jgi:plasmid maintenance system antidote protein VapI